MQVMDIVWLLVPNEMSSHPAVPPTVVTRHAPPSLFHMLTLEFIYNTLQEKGVRLSLL